ncbi:glycine-rich domain-containing protein, partial [Acidomonas methanolica]
MDYTTAPGYVLDAEGRRRIVARDLANNVPGTSATGVDIDALVCEAMNVIEGLAGLTGSAANLTQLGQAITSLIATDVRLLSTALEWQAVTAVGPTSIAIPSWATRVEIRAIGGGGAGSDSNVAAPSSGSFAGSGGGGGAYAWGTYAVSAATASELVVIVGAGGTLQGNGGASSVSYNSATLVTADGGQGGAFYAAEGSAGGDG